MSFMDLSAFLSRTSQQVTNVLNQAGSWARRKTMNVRRTRKTDENRKKSKHAQSLSHHVPTSINIHHLH